MSKRKEGRKEEDLRRSSYQRRREEKFRGDGRRRDGRRRIEEIGERKHIRGRRRNKFNIIKKSGV